jgi:plasmid maintenance system antidote protein VapI
MNRPLKTINEIINGKAAVTPDTAIQLERALGVSANFWIGMESNYREALARKADAEALEQEIDFIKRFPLRDLRRRGILVDTSATADTASRILRFFGVSSPSAWRRLWLSSEAAFRVSLSLTSTPEALACWVRFGELRATDVQSSPFDPRRFRELLHEMRSWTRLDPLETVIARMEERLPTVGVVFILVPELSGAPASGATYPLSKSRRVLQMSLRYKRDDQFWFTFFHEAGHVLGSGATLHVDAPEAFALGTPDEAEADAFARDLLIPPDTYAQFVTVRSFTEDAVRTFARDIGVSPGIVVGRLQRDDHLPQRSPLNHLKRPITWNDRT